MRRLAVGLAALVVAVPVAGAAPDPRGADGADGAVGSFAIHDRPVGGSTAGDPRALPADDGARPVQVVERPGGFDWGDGLAGAGVAFGLVLVGVAAARVTRHVSRPAAA